MKRFLATLAVISGLACASLPTYADTLLHFASDGGQSVGGVDVYPYNFNINGSTSLTQLMCLDFNREISFGEMWNANVVSIGLDNSQTSINERADAWIYSQLGTSSTADVQYAVWDIVDPTDVTSHTGFVNSTAAQNLEQTGLLMAQNATLISSGFFSHFSLYLADPTNQAGWTNGEPQDFIGLAQTPEPSSLLLMGSGLVGAAGALRRRLRSA